MSDEPVQYRGVEDYCGRPMENDTISVDVRFWVAGVSVSVVGIAGLVWNLLSLITLLTISKKSLFHKLLITLTIYDLLFIVTGGTFMLHQSLSFQSDFFNRLFPKVIFPLAGISMAGSIYTCAGIAIERYIGICFSHNDWVARKCRYFQSGIIFFIIITEGPKFFEIMPTLDDSGNVTGFAYTNLRNHPTYITVYTLWIRLIITGVIPFIIMLFCHVGIICYYRKNSFGIQNDSSEENSRLSGSPATSVNSRTSQTTSQPHAALSASQEKSLYVMFVCITLLYICCHLPRLILNVNEVPMNKRMLICMGIFKHPFHEPFWVVILTSVEKLALITNSSVNFFIYCFVGKAFREQMVQVLRKSLAFILKICKKSNDDASTPPIELQELPSPPLVREPDHCHAPPPQNEQREIIAMKEKNNFLTVPKQQFGRQLSMRRRSSLQQDIEEEINVPKKSNSQVFDVVIHLDPASGRGRVKMSRIVQEVQVV